MVVICLAAGCAKFNKKQDTVRLTVGGNAGALSYKHGLHAYRHGHLNKAANSFEKVIQKDPNHGAAYNNLGLVYFDQRNLALAAANFDRAIGLLPEDARPVNNLGMALEAGGRLDEAIGYYQRAAELEPANPLYLGNLVRARVRLGETGELLRQDMQQLAFIDNRPDWLEWVDEQLALRENPFLDRGPARRNPLSQQDSSTPGSPSEAEPIDLPPSFRLDDSTPSRARELELERPSDSLPVPDPRS